MTDAIDERVDAAGFRTRTEYLARLVDEFLAESDGPVELIPAPDYRVAEVVQTRMPRMAYTRFKRRAAALGTRPTALLRSLVYRDLDLPGAGVTAAPSEEQGVLFSDLRATG